jgi:hypothetical protein
MTSRRACLAIAVILAAILPGLAHAAAVDAYYERAVMTAADQRCRLFTPEMASALASAEAQAHGAALRSGLTAGVLDQVGQRAQNKVAGLSCSSPDIAKAADRVRVGFDGYSKLERMNFPGDTNDWLAVHDNSKRVPIWKLSQGVKFGWNSLMFGLAGKDGPSSLLAVASFPDNAQPYAARLLVRDPSLAPEPYLNVIKASTTGKLPLSARTPPRGAMRGIMAQDRQVADASLLPRGTSSGVAFRFPKSAADALAGLDPREAVAIEFQFASATGETVRTAYVEVGDFAAGRAFLAAAQR